MNFISDFRHPEKISDNSLWFLINGQKIVMFNENGKTEVPEYSNIIRHGVVTGHIQYMGIYSNVPCYAAEIINVNGLSESFSSYRPLSLPDKIGDDFFFIAGLANQLINWSLNHHYCGKCGAETGDKSDERAKICIECGQIYYPRISPAIIVAVTKGDSILLANASRFPSDLYSVLAGFVEPGESIEDCVKREVREEVGIEIKNIQYFGSQPWPFPDSLMIAFTAEYAQGKIKVDETEIAAAGWFKSDNLPNVPPGTSIAGKLIDWFINSVHPKT